MAGQAHNSNSLWAGLWLAAGVWAVPSKWWELGLSGGWAAPSWCSGVTKRNRLVPLHPSFILPCRTEGLALTSPDHSHPGASLCWGPHELQKRVPVPTFRLLWNITNFGGKWKAEERTQLNPNCLEYFSKECHFQASLEPRLSWWRSESGKIPSNRKYCNNRTLLLFPVIWKCPYSQI